MMPETLLVTALRSEILCREIGSSACINPDILPLFDVPGPFLQNKQGSRQNRKPRIASKDLRKRK